MTIADSLLEMLLRLPEGSALLLPTGTRRALVDIAIDNAAKADRTKQFKVSDYVSRANARAIVKTGVRGSDGVIRRPAIEEPVCFQSPGFRP
jgi:hypothetical protein